MKRQAILCLNPEAREFDLNGRSSAGELWLWVLFLAIAVACAAFPVYAAPAVAAPSPGGDRPQIQIPAPETPLVFQSAHPRQHPGAYLAGTFRYDVLLSPAELVITPRRLADRNCAGASPRQRLTVRFIDANRGVSIQGMDPLRCRVNYLVGADPQEWAVDLPTFSRVRYRQVYAGVDLVFRGTREALEFDFLLAPGANPAAVKMEIQGARRMRINAQGDLVLSIGADTVRLAKPSIYQDVGEQRRLVSGGFVLRGRKTVGFRLGDYDRRQSLVIDPVVKYATYLGGGDFLSTWGVKAREMTRDVAVDRAGNAYVVGDTESPNFPLVQPFQTTVDRGSSKCIDMEERVIPCGDVFVAKFSPTGELVYSTYLGGASDDDGNGIAVDDEGNIYVAGTTYSANFPTTEGAFQKSCAGNPFCTDAFVTKLDKSGSRLIYSTYLGGAVDLASPCKDFGMCHGMDGATAVAVDASGHAYVAGITDSTDFPVVSALQPAFAGCQSCKTGILFEGEGFLSKLNPDGSALEFSTYLGGSGDDLVYDLALNSQGDAFLTGWTRSTDFPTSTSVFQNAGVGVFVSRVNANGSLVYSTYVTADAFARGSGIAVDSESNAYITGSASSTGFPLVKPLLTQLDPFTIGPSGAFLSKLNPTGTSLLYSTYLAARDGLDVAVDREGCAYVTGIAPFSSGSADALILKVQSSGSALEYSIQTGGSGWDEGRAITVDPWGDVYVCGLTDSRNFTTVNAAQSTFGGGLYDVFVMGLLEPKTLLFSQFGGGGGFTSDLVLTNPSNLVAASGRADFLADDGSPLAVPISTGPGAGETRHSVDVTVPPLGVVVVSSAADGNLQVGSVRVTTDEQIGGVVRFKIPGIGIAGVGSCSADKGFVVPVRRNAAINTGVAVHNGGDQAIQLELTLYDPAGHQVAGGTAVIQEFPAQGHLAKFIHELFPEANTFEFEGTLVIQAATGKISATALELGTQPGEFTTLPVVPTRY